MCLDFLLVGYCWIVVMRFGLVAGILVAGILVVVVCELGLRGLIRWFDSRLVFCDCFA